MRENWGRRRARRRPPAVPLGRKLRPRPSAVPLRWGRGEPPVKTSPWSPPCTDGLQPPEVPRCTVTRGRSELEPASWLGSSPTRREQGGAESIRPRGRPRSRGDALRLRRCVRLRRSSDLSVLGDHSLPPLRTCSSPGATARQQAGKGPCTGSSRAPQTFLPPPPRHGPAGPVEPVCGAPGSCRWARRPSSVP